MVLQDILFLISHFTLFNGNLKLCLRERVTHYTANSVLYPYTITERCVQISRPFVVLLVSPCILKVLQWTFQKLLFYLNRDSAKEVSFTHKLIILTKYLLQHTPFEEKTISHSARQFLKGERLGTRVTSRSGFGTIA